MSKNKSQVCIPQDVKMKQRAIFATVSLALLLSIGGLMTQHQTNAIETLAKSYTSQEASIMTSSPKQTNPKDQLIQGNTQFGFNLFRTLVQQDKDKNIFVSPTGVSLALSMLYNGAAGKTQQDMATALGYKGMSLKQINQANRALSETLKKESDKLKIAIANSLWAREGVAFRHQFLKNNQEFYKAQITNLDFTNPASVKIINNWVKDKTRGKIDKVIGNIGPANVLFLINAIYFKGMWQKQFDKKLTSEQTFYLVNGKTKKHPLMSATGKYQYYENDQFQAVSLPYGDGRLSMYIFLPRGETKLSTFLNQLTPEKWEQWLSKFDERQGSLKIPRFKLEYEVRLNDALKALGMSTIFKNADFSEMTSIDVAVNEVKHKTYVEVNEEGTEAAAVTSIGIGATSGMSTQEPFNLVVNRPFFSVIRDNQTGTVLFMGAIFEPK